LPRPAPRGRAQENILRREMTTQRRRDVIKSQCAGTHVQHDSRSATRRSLSNSLIAIQASTATNRQHHHRLHHSFLRLVSPTYKCLPTLYPETTSSSTDRTNHSLFLPHRSATPPCLGAQHGSSTSTLYDKVRTAPPPDFPMDDGSSMTPPMTPPTGDPMTR